MPKLLGTYELELHGVVEALCEAAPARIVVAGAAEGYYAVGLALRLPGARVVAYEANPRGRALLAASWEDNGLAAERLVLRDICTASALREEIRAAPGGWLVMDVEGAEAILADPVVIPELGEVSMLLEVHEFALPGVGALLRERFRTTHVLQSIPARARRPADFPPALRPRRLPRLFDGAARALMDEQRPPGMSWMVLRPLPR